MTLVATIVEGDGEVAAVPVLLRRLIGWKSPQLVPQVLTPIRVYKDRFLNREEEFCRHLRLAGAKAGDGGWVLLLFDADDDCPAHKGAQILARAKAVLPHRRCAVVLANREFEAWFIAAAASLGGHRGFQSQIGDGEADAESPRNAKGWIAARLPSGVYRETTDQPALAARMDLALAHRRSRSFRKLCAEWERFEAVLA